MTLLQCTMALKETWQKLPCIVVHVCHLPWNWNHCGKVVCLCQHGGTSWPVLWQTCPPPPYPGTIEGKEEEIVSKATWDLCKDITIIQVAGPTVNDINEPAWRETSVLPIYAMKLTLILVSMSANYGVDWYLQLQPSPCRRRMHPSITKPCCKSVSKSLLTDPPSMDLPHYHWCHQQESQGCKQGWNMYEWVPCFHWSFVFN